MVDALRPEMQPGELRARAQALLAARDQGTRPADAAPCTEEELQQTLHELRVHQIELELQNEELRRTQVELECSRQRWFELYDLAPVGYCTVSAGGLIQQVNLAAAELLGLPRAALARRRFSEFILPADQHAYYDLHAQLLGSGEPQSCELRMAGERGTERWIQLSATATLPDEQGERSLRIVMVDVTARRQAQAAEAALRLAEQTARNRNEFLSRVSHEFRTPLHAILGFSHVLLNEASALSPTSQRQLQHIRNAGNHLLRMVTDLLDISRMSSGQLTLKIVKVDPIGSLNEAIQDVASQAKSAGITVEMAPHDGAAATVSADATRLRQVFQNLLSNAIKYSRDQGRVRLRLARNGPFWRVHIADDGVGMTHEQQAGLFQPFNRLGRERSGIEGTGLGLVIARDLVHAMGGALTVRSEPGQGTELLVDLLASEPAPGAVRAAPGADDQVDRIDAPVDLRGRVLCVEDDPGSRELIRHILGSWPGIEVEIVENGAACIAAARRAWPDLVLLDQRLPDIPGLEVLKVLRQLNPQLPLRCIVVSAEVTPEDIGRARAAGADEFVAKPIDPDRMKSVVGHLVARPMRQDGPQPGGHASRDGSPH
jgi:PAS domain S-box-containing protein